MRFSLSLKLGIRSELAHDETIWLPWAVQVWSSKEVNDWSRPDRKILVTRTSSEADIEFIKGLVTICDHELPEAGVKVQYWGGTNQLLFVKMLGTLLTHWFQNTSPINIKI